MEKKCMRCGGELKAGVLRTKSHLSPVCYTPLEDVNKVKARNVVVLCDACVSCGAIENIRLEETNAFNR